MGATLHRGARASHYRGLSCCGAQAPDAQAHWLWLTGPVAPWHVGSSPTRARTRVPCIGRQTLNHCATREALCWILDPRMLTKMVRSWSRPFSSSLFIVPNGEKPWADHPFDVALSLIPGSPESPCTSYPNIFFNVLLHKN